MKSLLCPSSPQGVKELSQEDVADMDAFGFDEEAERDRLGVRAWVGGEAEAYPSVLARRWHRPTLEIVGMAGG